MKYEELLDLVGDLPIFRASLLLAGDRNAEDVRRQLSRWKTSGKVIQLRRNVYVLARPWRRVEPHPFGIANELQRPSYVSLESALAHHGLIPEAVPVTTSVTTGRTSTVDTPLGRFVYRHLRSAAFFGYRPTRFLNNQDALVADPGKALLDLAYLTPDGDSVEYLESLRLENLGAIETEVLAEHQRRWSRPKIDRAVQNIVKLAQMEAEERS